MKQYDGINQNKSKESVQPVPEPEKKTLNYDIGLEIGVKQRSQMSYDINKEKRKKRNAKIAGMILSIGVVVSGGIFAISSGFIDINQIKSTVASIIPEKNVADDENKPVVGDDNDALADPFKSQEGISFIPVGSANVVYINDTDTLIFKSDSLNEKNDVVIEFSVKNASTGQYCCDEFVYGGKALEWMPGTYLKERGVEYILGITQTAFKSDDLTTPIGSHYSELTVCIGEKQIEPNVIEPDVVEITPVEDVTNLNENELIETDTNTEISDDIEE